MSKDIVKVREKDVQKRIADFTEVVLGYNEDEALLEAKRCIQCKKPACIDGCPVGIDIKTFIARLCEKDYKAAYYTIREKNSFASICGRVCPAEYQCRKTCVLSKKGLPFASEKAINIHFLERFIGDYGMNERLDFFSKPEKDLSGVKVAVVGSGPAGLSCAGELARFGVHVIIYESLHKSGGVLRYGIPGFRLPRDILDYEISALKKLNVEIMPNVIIGNNKTVNELFSEGFSAVFLGLGAGTPSFLGVSGENLCNVYSANEFLTRVNLMGAYMFPAYHTPINVGKHICVIGGGNTAMDAARVALRLQNISGLKPNVTVLYRRTETEMPARRLEIEHAKEEGITFKLLVQPVAFTGDDRGYLKEIECLQCELGEPDASGRRRPVPVKGSNFKIACDVAVIALGLKANQVLIRVTPELQTDKYGDIIVNKDTMETSIKNVYAGGDIVGGEGTVIEAMGMGKKAAHAIIDRL